MTTPSTQPRRLWRSTGAVLAGLIAIVVLSTVTDEAMHGLHVFPRKSQPMRATGLFLLALTYRSVIGVLGGYIAAALAPREPLLHAVILGMMGWF